LNSRLLMALGGMLINLPAGLVIGLVGALAFRVCATRVEHSEGAQVALRCWRGRFWRALLIATLLQSIAWALFSGPYESVARTVVVYPASAIFRLLPGPIVRILPELALLFVGAGSALGLTFVVVVGLESLVPYASARRRAA
jgi:predicted membrane metal-binding protein